MDDSNGAPKVSYLDAAIKGALANETLTSAETKARGCGVQYQNK